MPLPSSRRYVDLTLQSFRIRDPTSKRNALRLRYDEAHGGSLVGGRFGSAASERACCRYRGGVLLLDDIQGRRGPPHPPSIALVYVVSVACYMLHTGEDYLRRGRQPSIQACAKLCDAEAGCTGWLRVCVCVCVRARAPGRGISLIPVQMWER